jgi:hypothetical protein
MFITRSIDRNGNRTEVTSKNYNANHARAYKTGKTASTTFTNEDQLSLFPDLQPVKVIRTKSQPAKLFIVTALAAILFASCGMKFGGERPRTNCPSTYGRAGYR